MDLEEWEVLQEDGFLEKPNDDDDGGKKTMFNMDYFICPPSNPSQLFIQPKNHVHVAEEQRSGNKAFEPQTDVGESYDVGLLEGTKNNIVSSPRSSTVGGIQENHEGFNLWNWSLTGIGAICAFGVAAAATTICIIFIDSHHKHKRQQNHKIRFQIYADNKRMREATKMKEAISTVKGVPFTRAQITFGGYCDAF